jgi:hypothetical protein
VLGGGLDAIGAGAEIDTVEIEALVQAGIVDPAKVARVALSDPWRA